MSVEIKQLTDESYTVNDKTVYKDINNHWVAKEELTTAEAKAFRRFLSALIKTEREN